MQSWQATSYYLSLLAAEFSEEQVNNFSHFKEYKNDLSALCAAKEYYYEHGDLKMPEHKSIIAKKNIMYAFLLLVDSDKQREAMRELLYWSAHYDYKASVKYLYKRGISPMSQSKMFTPLQIAVVSNSKSVIAFFKRKGCLNEKSLSELLQQNAMPIHEKDEKGDAKGEKCVIN